MTVKARVEGVYRQHKREIVICITRPNGVLDHVRVRTMRSEPEGQRDRDELYAALRNLGIPEEEN